MRQIAIFFVISSRKIIIKIRRVLKIKVKVRCNFFSPYRKQNLKMLTGNTLNYFISTFHILKSKINFNKLLLVSGFWLLVSINAVGQPPDCPNPVPQITFYDGHQEFHQEIDMCHSIGQGQWQDDIDINTNDNGARQWMYSTVGPDPNPESNWIILPYTGNQLVISSFYSSPGHYWFKLRLTNGCWVESNVIDLIVNNIGTAPSPPIGPDVSRCGAGIVNLSATVAPVPI